MRAAAVSWGMALGLTMSATALAGPPVQRPVSPTQQPAPTDQPVLDEEPPAEAEVPPPAELDVEPAPPAKAEPPVGEGEPPPVDSEPPPVEVEPAPEPASLPRYDAGLPSDGAADAAAPLPSEWSEFDTPAAPVQDSAPPTGRGRMAVGAILFGGSVVLTSVAVPMFLLTEDVALGLSGLVVSGGAMTTGILLMATGAGRRKKYQTWAEGYGGERAIPPAGAGLLAAGTTCMVAGPLGVLVGGISLTLQDEQDLPYGQVLIPLGAVSFAGGLTMLIIGAKRKQKYTRWHSQHVITPSFSLLPAGPTRVGGASFGLAGRF